MLRPSQGLRGVFKAGHVIASYGWSNIDPDAHAIVAHQITRLHLKYLNLIPLEATHVWDSRLPLVARAISPDIFQRAFPDGIEFILASPQMLEKDIFIAHTV